MRVRALCVSVVIGGVLAGAPAAFADAPVSTVSEVAAAVASEGQPAATSLSSVDLPASGSGSVSGPGGIELGIPATGAASVVGDTAVYRSDESSRAQVAVQAVAGGVRALVNIDSAAAPERYDFPLGGEVAALRAEADGSVTTLNAAGSPIGTVAPAWAVDKNGTSVPTHYEINGTTLTQIVNHQGGGYAYGITADPRVERHWWGTQIWLSNSEVSRLGKVLGAGAGAAGVAAVLGSTVAGPVAAAIAAGYAAVDLCNWNDRGVVFTIIANRIGWCYPR